MPDLSIATFQGGYPSHGTGGHLSLTAHTMHLSVTLPSITDLLARQIFDAASTGCSKTLASDLFESGDIFIYVFRASLPRDCSTMTTLYSRPR